MLILMPPLLYPQVRLAWRFNISLSNSPGGIRQQFSTPQNIQICQYGYQFLRNIDKHLSVGSWVPEISWTHGPYLFLASEKGIDILMENYQYASALFRYNLNRTQIAAGVKVKLVSKDELPVAFPWLNPEGIEMASVTLEGEGWVDPFGLLMAFKKKAQSLGVEYINV